MLVIGDVVGHDTEAAAAMGQLRGLLRGIATYSDAGPVEVLRGLDASMTTLQTRTLATAAVARFEQTPDELERGVTRMRWANAGHLPPLIINPDGSVAELATWKGDLLLGVDPEARRRESVVTLDRGSTVLLYTDGLIERRDADLDARTGPAARHPDRARRPPAGRAARRGHRAARARPTRRTTSRSSPSGCTARTGPGRPRRAPTTCRRTCRRSAPPPDVRRGRGGPWPCGP